MTAVIGALVAVAVIVVVLRLVFTGRLLVKYAALWLIVALVIVVLALVPRGLEEVARLLGFQVPANLLFFAGIALLLFVTLHLSLELTRVERRSQRLAEEVALLKTQDGERSSDSASAPDDGAAPDATPESASAPDVTPDAAARGDHGNGADEPRVD